MPFWLDAVVIWQTAGIQQETSSELSCESRKRQSTSPDMGYTN